MAQPTGPQAGAVAPPPPSPLRAAAGRDTSFSTLRPWQAGHLTSASSARRMTSSSNVRSQALQLYS